jgi:hypothetical protein
VWLTRLRVVLTVDGITTSLVMVVVVRMPSLSLGRWLAAAALTDDDDGDVACVRTRRLSRVCSLALSSGFGLSFAATCANRYALDGGRERTRGGVAGLLWRFQAGVVSSRHSKKRTR